MYDLLSFVYKYMFWTFSVEVITYRWLSPKGWGICYLPGCDGQIDARVSCGSTCLNCHNSNSAPQSTSPLLSSLYTSPRSSRLLQLPFRVSRWAFMPRNRCHDVWPRRSVRLMRYVCPFRRKTRRGRLSRISWDTATRQTNIFHSVPFNEECFPICWNTSYFFMLH